jgi:hypothetical protein
MTLVTRTVLILYLKNCKIKWYATAPRLQKKRSPADIIRKPAGRAPGVEPEVPSDAFQLLLMPMYLTVF